MFAEQLGRSLARFAKETNANVAVVFAIVLLPVAGFTGAAVDYAHGNSVKAAMQAAADATALMLAKNIDSFPSDQINQKAGAYFLAMFNRPETTGVQVSATYVKSNAQSVTVNAGADVKTNFLGVLGISTMRVGVSARTAWGTSAKMQVALALDNTGSMANYFKMDSLKTATHSLLDQLKATAANPNDVNVAIVPFSKDVNVGTKNYNASWIDWSDWDDDNGSDSTTTTCQGSSTGRNGKAKKKCVTSTTWVPADHKTWNGCITDRDQDYDVKNTSPNPSDKNLSPSVASTLFPAEQYESCPVAMMGLTNDWTSLHSLVDSMSPAGNTNQAIGLAWAWQAVTQGQPMTAPGKSADMQQVIILLTDGLNTEDRWYSNQTAIDARQKTLCDNVKSANITLYTIQVNIGNIDPVSTLLQQCASKPEYFFHLTTAGAIASVFNAIGNNITKLRIVR